MSPLDVLAPLVRDLGEACGFDLVLIEESLIVDGAYVAATARSLPSSQQVRLEALAKLQISPVDAGGTETWAMVFFFVNGQRVAPPGRCHLTLKQEPAQDGAGRWVPKGWKADVYDEWTGLERLEDDQ